MSTTTSMHNSISTGVPTCFCVHCGDNVATMLMDAQPGPCAVVGEGDSHIITLIDAVPCGHKVALRQIAVDEPVIKYGIVIGHARQPLESGRHIHLHNCRSVFDERSATLNVHDGSPSDTPYE